MLQCVMASTIVVALDGLFAQVFTVPGLWYSQRWDCVSLSYWIKACKTAFGNQSQNTALPLVNLEMRHVNNQSEAWIIRLVSKLSFRP